MPKVLLYGGKGGVGKTTCAAATGLALARDGRETLVVSTDPAHSLADAYDTSLAASPEQIEPRLAAVETDRETGTVSYRRLFEAVADALDDAGIDLDPEAVEELFTGGAVPGGDELAALDAIAQYADEDRWDTVIFDTAPTGHTLRLLEIPETVGTGVRTAVSLRDQVQRKTDAARTLVLGPYATLGRSRDEEAAADAEFVALADRMDRVATILRDADRTDFRVVCTPERLVLAETRRLVASLREFDIPVGTALVNRVLTDPNPDCPRCRSQAAAQSAIVDEIRAAFPELAIVTLPDLTGTRDADAVLDRLASTVPT